MSKNPNIGRDERKRKQHIWDRCRDARNGEQDVWVTMPVGKEFRRCKLEPLRHDTPLDCGLHVIINVNGSPELTLVWEKDGHVGIGLDRMPLTTFTKKCLAIVEEMHSR